MPAFSYSAYVDGGSVESGAVDAATERDALRVLSARGRRVFSISEAGAKQVSATGSKSAFDPASLARLFGELAVLLEAGLPFDSALGTLVDGERKPRKKALLQAALGRIREGQPVAASLDLLTTAPDVLAMLASGERGGSMATVCRRLAAAFEARVARRTALIDALAYPAFLLVVMAVSLGVLAFVLVPAIKPVFEGSGRPAPLAIRLLGSLGRTLAGQTPTLLGAAIASLLVVWLAMRSEAIPRLFARAVLAAPLAGPVIRQSVAARYLGTLSLLLGNGVPMMEALGLSRRAIGWSSVRATLESIENEVAAGATLRAAARRPGLFDHASLSFIALGEEANALPAVLKSASEAMERAVARRIDGLLKLMTPALTITLGLLVGSLVISVMTAILSINDLALR